MLISDERIVRLEVRVDGQETVIGEVRNLVIALDQKMDRRFESLEQRMDQRFHWLVGLQFGILIAIMAALLKR